MVIKMDIKNISDKARFCEDKLILSGESFSTEENKYLVSASKSPELFEIKKTNKKQSKVKKDGSN